MEAIPHIEVKSINLTILSQICVSLSQGSLDFITEKPRALALWSCHLVTPSPVAPTPWLGLGRWRGGSWASWTIGVALII